MSTIAPHVPSFHDAMAAGNNTSQSFKEGFMTHASGESFKLCTSLAWKLGFLNSSMIFSTSADNAQVREQALDAIRDSIGFALNKAEPIKEEPTPEPSYEDRANATLAARILLVLQENKILLEYDVTQLMFPSEQLIADGETVIHHKE